MQHIEQALLAPAVPALSGSLQRKILIAVTIAVGIALLVPTLYTKVVGSHAAAKAPVASPDSFRPTPVQMAGLKIASIAMLAFHGELVTDGKIAVNGNTTTPVFSPFSGRVTRVMANPGDSVKQGQTLLEVEATEFIQAQNDLISGTAALDTARAQLAQAELVEKRKHALYDAKGSSLQEWQQSQADLVVAQSSFRSADSALAAVHNRLRILGKSDADVSSIAASRKIGSLAVVVAPINGTVTDRQVGLGQYIQSGASNPVYAISNLSTVWLVGNVRETDVPAIRRGMPVEVRVLAYPERVFKAKLTYIAPGVDPTTHRVMVRAEVDNPDGALKPEMFASFSVLTAGESKAPAIPDSAVIYEGQTARAWVAKDDGTLALRQIRLGRTSGGMFEVLSGASAGEKVVTSGTLFIDRAASQD